jgi:adenine-specific DNA-methyltransferase
MSKTTKLELTWIGKENRPLLEPRILLEDGTKSYHAKKRVSKQDTFDNRLIFGDNLLALRALEQEFTGKVACIFIDPPTTRVVLLHITTMASSTRSGSR